jgi:hypothetical protein
MNRKLSAASRQDSPAKSWRDAALIEIHPACALVPEIGATICAN